MKIDKNVPMPSRSPSNSYNWKFMEIGDSVFFDNEPNATQAKQPIAARTWGYSNGVKFSSRTEGNGVRIWRIS